ncbi:LysR family transcriptional regulator [Actinomadura sp. LOL_016]|uniref:LysR family transcriptional regulator n=1 Tax=unclassified Actinomadura TaxID=2626254 RepID=UPI003A8108AC
MIDLYKLHYFLVVARAGSYVQAAEELHMSQPAISRSIQTLERQFGVALLDRGRNGVSVTNIGRQVMRYADDLLYNAETLERMLAGAATGTSGQVQFGVGPVAAAVLLPLVSGRVIREYPEISLKVHSGSDAEMTTKLLTGEIEFFLGRVDPAFHNDRVVVDELGATRFRVHAREGHPLAGTERLALSDLAPFPRLGGTAWRELVAQQAPPEERDLLRPSIEIDNFAILRDIALHTDAVIMTSYGDLSGLVVLPTRSQAQQEMAAKIAIFSLATRSLSPAARTVARSIRHAALETIPMTDTSPGEPSYLHRSGR